MDEATAAAAVAQPNKTILTLRGSEELRRQIQERAHAARKSANAWCIEALTKALLAEQQQ